MPGQVRELFVAEGDQVQKGDLLLLLEAMKMEIRIQAPRAASIKSLSLKAGDAVEKDQILVELEDFDDDKNQADA
jgi:biotin carboxyl carrier protein